MKGAELKCVLMFVSLLIASFGFSPQKSMAAVTYDWKIPQNVRIVQKDDIDNTRIFGNISSAMASISNPSDTNRFLIKVMPGIYSGKVTTKPYVKIAGSGQDVTVLTTSDSDVTVKCSDMSEIENITVTYDSPFRGNLLTLDNNANVTLKKVKLLMPNNVYVSAIQSNFPGKLYLTDCFVYLGQGTSYGSDMALDIRYIELYMRNSKIEMHSGTPNVSVAIFAAIADIANSEMILSSSGAMMAFTDCNPCRINRSVININTTGQGFEAITGNLDMNNSTINLSGTVTYAYIPPYGITGSINNSSIISSNNGIKLDNGGVKIYNTSVIANNNAIHISYNPLQTVQAYIHNSIIAGGVKSINKDVYFPGGFVAGASQLSGPFDFNQTTDKVANCYDGNFSPIVVP